MKATIYLPIKNLPYISGDENRPHFYDPISKKNTFDVFDKEYFQSKPIESNVVSYTGFDEGEWKFQITDTDRDFLREIGNIKIKLDNETFPRYYFCVLINDDCGVNSVRLKLELDYWLTYWNLLDYEDGYAKILRHHQNRFTSEKKFDFSPSNPLWNDDAEMARYKPHYPLKTCQGIKSVIDDEDFNFGYDNTLAGGKENPNAEEKYNEDNLFVYAFVTYLSKIADKPPTNDYMTSGGSIPLPVMIVPLSLYFLNPKLQVSFSGDPVQSDNSYANIIKSGNNAFIKVIAIDFPILTNNDYSNLVKIAGLNDLNNLYGIDLDKIKLGPRKQFFKKAYYEDFELNLVDYPTTFTYDVPYNYQWEPKIYMSAHQKNEIQIAFAKKQIFVEKLDDINTLKLYHINSFDITNDIKVCVLDSKVYGNVNNLDYQSLLVNASFSLAETSNAYTNYFQEHKNAFNTSRWALNKRATTNDILGSVDGIFGGAMSGAMGGSALPVVGTLAGAGIGAILGAFKAGSNIVRNEMERSIGNRQLDSQKKDLENTPETIKDVSDRDLYSLNVLNLSYFNLGIDDNRRFPTTHINIYGLTQQEKEIIAFHYARNGYLINRMIKINKEWISNRYRFNYLQINNFHTCLKKDKLPFQVITWFDKIFEKGVRLWTIDDGTDIDRKNTFNDYTYENWEISLLGSK